MLITHDESYFYGLVKFLIFWESYGTETLALFEYRRRRRRRRTLRPRVTKTAHFLWRTRRGSKTRLEGDCLKEEEEIFGGWRVFF